MALKLSIDLRFGLRYLRKNYHPEKNNEKVHKKRLSFLESLLVINYSPATVVSSADISSSVFWFMSASPSSWTRFIGISSTVP